LIRYAPSICSSFPGNITFHRTLQNLLGPRSNILLPLRGHYCTHQFVSLCIPLTQQVTQNSSISPISANDHICQPGLINPSLLATPPPSETDHSQSPLLDPRESPPLIRQLVHSAKSLSPSTVTEQGSKCP
jgi:hypothetical protein